MGLGALPRRTSTRTAKATLALALLATSCTAPPGEARSPVPGPTGTPPSTLRVALEDPVSLDPMSLQSPASLLVASQIFDGLTEVDPETLDVSPAASSGWRVRGGGTRFTFELRPAGRFHDGKPVEAGDFERAWNRLADPSLGNPFAFLLSNVQGYQRYRNDRRIGGLSGVRALSERELEVTLLQPSQDFPALVAHPALSPVPAAAEGPEFQLRPVGNGPYRLGASVGGAILLERFAQHPGPPPEIASAVFTTFDRPDRSWPSFLAGELEVTEIPPPVLPDALGRFGSAGVVTLGRLLYCGFNLAQERFQNRPIRVAVSLAVDRERLVADVYGGTSQVARGIVPPSFPGHGDDVCGSECSRDLDRARRLVERVPAEDREFVLDYPRSTVGDALANEMSSQLGEVGLTVTPRAHDTAEYRLLLEERGQDMFCLVQVADYPRQASLLQPLLQADSPDNHAGFEDGRVEDLLGQAGAERTGAVRQNLYREAERRALEVMPILPVAWFRSHLAVQPYVGDFALDPLGTFDVARLNLEP